MVCSFGLTPEASAWLVTRGSDAIGNFQKQCDAVMSVTNLLGNGGGTSAYALRRSQLATALGEEHKGHVHSGTEEKKEEGMGCFPASASVYVKGRGPVAISDVRFGDLLLCGDAVSDSLMFSPFLGHMHTEGLDSADYLLLEFSKSSQPLLVSREHFVFAARSATSALTPQRAGDLREGDWLAHVSCDGDLGRVQIQSVTNSVHKVGRYAPLTSCGTIIVNGALCSCYADAFPDNAATWLRSLCATHEAAHCALLPLRLLCNFNLGRHDPADSTSQNGIHPYCRALMALPRAVSAA